ncbi:MAG: type II toxin-antitoxin system HicA family toxin [Candidatus Electrothrix communis]|nr:MAG: type II toxin-antitoxin system HicA family toxin [Candidatus Electrothrix communis]
MLAHAAVHDIVYYMNSRHRKTLRLIFTDPCNGNIEWRKIESLFLSLGAVRTERAGSAVSFVLNDVRADFHRPHPDKAALRYRVKDARNFLKKAGVAP